VVILVIVFGCIEIRIGRNFRYNRIAEGAAFIQFCFIFFGLFFLLVIVIKNNTAILGTYVISLPVKRGWVVCLPEYFQQFVVRDLLGIIHYLYTFCMAGVTGAYFFVGRVSHMSATIA